MSKGLPQLHDTENASLASSEEYLAAARAYLQRRDLRAAVLQLAGAVARDPGHRPSHSLLWEVLGASRDPEILLRLSGDVFFGLAGVRALYCARIGRMGEALSLLSRLIRFRPEKTFVTWACAWESSCACPTDELAEFVEASLDACIESPSDGALENLRGLVGLLDLARRRAPDHEGLLLAQVRVFCAVGVPERALALVRPNRPDVSQELAHELARACFEAEAEEQEAIWLERVEPDVATRCRLAELALLRGDLAAALAKLEYVASQRAERVRRIAQSLSDSKVARKQMFEILEAACRAPESAAVDAVGRLVHEVGCTPATRLRVFADRSVSRAELAVSRALTSAVAPELVLDWRVDESRSEFLLGDFEVPQAPASGSDPLQVAVWKQGHQAFAWTEWVAWARDRGGGTPALTPHVVALDPDQPRSVDAQAMGQLAAWGLLFAMSEGDVPSKLVVFRSWFESGDPWVARAAVIGLAALSELAAKPVSCLVDALVPLADSPSDPTSSALLASLALVLGVSPDAAPRVVRALLMG